MICMRCDHAANTMGCFLGGGLQVSASVCAYLYVRVCKALYRFFFCALHLKTSPVDEPELSFCGVGGGGLVCVGC